MSDQGVNPKEALDSLKMMSRDNEIVEYFFQNKRKTRTQQVRPGLRKLIRLLLSDISEGTAVFAERQCDDLIALGHDGSLNVVAVLKRIGEVDEGSIVFHYGVDGDGDLLVVGQFTLTPGLRLGGFLFLQGNVLGGFTGLIDDGDAHFCGFFLGFLFLSAGGENNQRHYENEYQCDNFFHDSFLPFFNLISQVLLLRGHYHSAFYFGL